MGTANHFETERLSIQATLDANKTCIERNKLGQFATPTQLAMEILAYGLSILPTEVSIRFLDPAIGTGSFYSALLQTKADRPLDVAAGYEIDPHYGVPAHKLWAKSGLKINLADFTKATPQEQFNLIICNPPYVRHHHISSTEKKRLKVETTALTGISLSGLAGLYCYFILLSRQWMSKDGVACWLIPSEFMDVNYGRELKRFLLEEVTLLRIHRFDPENVQFDDALVSSAIVWFRNEKPPVDHCIEFTYGGTHTSPSFSRILFAAELKTETKWSRFSKQKISPARTNTPILSNFFDIKRGIATGSNDFFILTREKIQELHLPLACFRPILPSPRHINVGEILADKDGNPILSPSLFVLNCRLPENEIKKNYPSLWRYLETSKKEIASRYLCRSRKKWYWQEERLAAPFVCTYMGRGNTRMSPFRFLLNHSRAIAANTYLMLYPKPHLADIISHDPRLLKSIWQALNQTAPETLIAEGRVYGGGLYKIEPIELSKLPVEHVDALLKRHNRRSIKIQANRPLRKDV